ncbi:metallophosphoesterase [Pigmentibacter sp. JX0631]|uniref:metallophosphoesterase n=1 Tax=Pigmentibacter sp. JX0631 TaxID=2976982 RepID=UPI002468F616|nr:metallophosphoesterase [Pigmentibacter sp. JX0631]WGL59383.1 metallophosphoesterase [Pigmentibacter sp. JX0631]
MRKILSFIFYGIILFSCSLAVAKDFLSISDIHFNPLEICEDPANSNCVLLIEELHVTEANSWAMVFKKYNQTNKITIYGKNTNYILFNSFLEEIKNQTTKKKFEFVIVLGDFLAHFFIQNYNKYTKDMPKNKYDSIDIFVQKTMQYIAYELRKSIGNNIEIFPVLGNNDSSVDNYNVDNPKKSNFYKNLQSNWGNLNKSILNSSSFLEGGYYIADTGLTNLKIIALNTNIFSINAKSQDNINLKNMANNQLKWLENIFKKNTKDNFLIISHIPSGVDAYTTAIRIEKSKDKVSFWSSKNYNIENNYLKIISNYSNNINGIFVGHTHHDGFQILNQELGLYTVSVPSVSPVHFNNPAFKIFSLNETFNLENSVTNYFDLKEKKWIQGTSFNELFESKNIFIGIQSLVGKWLNQLSEPDEKFMKYFFVNSPFANQIRSKWKYYACAMSDNLESSDYLNCINQEN